jgi:hypothetical protein
MPIMAQILPPGSIMYRIGRSALVWGDPWEFQTVRIPTGELLGLTANPEQSVGKFTPKYRDELAHYFDVRGLNWTYERKNHGKTRTFRSTAMEMKIVMEVTRDDGKLTSRTTQEYFEMDYGNVVKVETAIAGGLLALGQAKVAAS